MERYGTPDVLELRDVATPTPKADEVLVRDEVYGDLCMSGFGAFAEYGCAPRAGLARKPPAMTFEQAAAIPQAGSTAQ